VRVVVSLHPRRVGVLTVTAGVYGSPDEAFRLAARQDMPKILDRARRELENARERRAHPRFRAAFPIRVYPVRPGGAVEGPVAGGCEDVSAGGVRFVTDAPVPADQVYLEFPGVGGAAGHGVLAGLIRAVPGAAGGCVAVGRFEPAPRPG
jgi:hypothetical protein